LSPHFPHTTGLRSLHHAAPQGVLWRFPSHSTPPRRSPCSGDETMHSTHLGAAWWSSLSTKFNQSGVLGSSTTLHHKVCCGDFLHTALPHEGLRAVVMKLCTARTWEQRGGARKIPTLTKFDQKWGLRELHHAAPQGVLWRFPSHSTPPRRSPCSGDETMHSTHLGAAWWSSQDPNFD